MFTSFLARNMGKAFAVAAVIIGVVAGFYFGKSGSVSIPISGKNVDQTIKEIFSNVPFNNNFSGVIKEISKSGNYFTVDVVSLSGLNLPEAYKNKKINIIDGTKIILLEQKDEETFRKEMDAQSKAMLKNPAGFIPVSPFIEKEISFSDLKVGDNAGIFLVFKEGASVLDKEFSATQISVSRNR